MIKKVGIVPLVEVLAPCFCFSTFICAGSGYITFPILALKLMLSKYYYYYIIIIIIIIIINL